MAVTLPAVGSFNWGDALNAAVQLLDTRTTKLEGMAAGGMKATVAQAGFEHAQVYLLTFGAATHNVGGMVELANNRLKTTIAGIYAVYGLIAFAPNATGYRRAAIYKNGVAQITNARDANQTGGLAGTVDVHWEGSFATNDLITLAGLQTSGVTLSTSVTSPYNSYLCAHLVYAT